MGIIDKLTGHSSSSHSKHADQTTTSAPRFGEDSTLGGQNTTTSTSTSGTGTGNTGFGSSSSTTGTTGSDAYGTDRKKGLGEKAKEAVGLDPKDNQNDPKDRGYGTTGSTGSSSYGRDATTGENMIRDNNSGLTSGTSSEHRGIDRQSERMGNMSMNDLSTGSTTGSSTLGSDYNKDSYDVKTAAPVVQERIHDQYENIDKTRVEELHDRTEVKQTVQPVYDEKTEAVQRDRVDHGLEIHEHGKAGLDSRTEAELAAKREALAREHRSSHDENTTERSLRPEVDRQERTNVIEEVVPVVEKDIYRPHEIEHNKRVVNIHHEAPVVAGTSVAKPVSLKEWESQGHSITGSSTTTRGRSGTSSSSSSSSSDEEGRRTGTRTTRKKGLGEKVKEAVGMDPKDSQNDPKDAGYGNTTTGPSTGVGSGLGSSSTTGYGNSGATGYDNTSSSTGTGSSSGYGNSGYNNNNSTTGSTGLGSSTSTTGTGNTGSSTGYGNTSSNQYDQSNTDSGVERKKGMGEKIKEKLGLDPKVNDPKDQGYTGGHSSSTY